MTDNISQQRSKNYTAQIKGSFVFKILAMGASFLIIPIMLKYLGVERYGIWSTLLSIVSWIVMFDLGIGNGLRNKISEALAKENKIEAQKYISTAYILIFIITAFLMIIYLFSSTFIPWKIIFNTKLVAPSELKNTVDIVVCSMLLNFLLSLINQVANGLQKTSITVFNQFLSNIFALGLVYILSLYTEGSLVSLAMVYGASLIVANVIITFAVFRRYRELKPKIRLYSKALVRPITSLGFQFFIIQIAVIIIFTTDKILITQLFGPEYVAEYDVVFKLFSIISVFHGIIMAPLWAAYADAYHKGDLSWIENTLKTQLKLFVLFFCSSIILVFLTPYVIIYWVGSDFEIDMKLVSVISIFVIISIWSNIFSYFVNAINRIKIQLYSSIIAMLINIPLSIFIVKFYQTGTYGVVIATIISLTIFSVIGPIQTYMILKNEK